MSLVDLHCTGPDGVTSVRKVPADTRFDALQELLKIQGQYVNFSFLGTELTSGGQMKT